MTSAPARSAAQPLAQPTAAAGAPPCASPVDSQRPGPGEVDPGGNTSSQESNEVSRLAGVRRAPRKGRIVHSSRASLAAEHVDRRQAGVAAQQREQAHSLEQQRQQVKQQRAQLQVRGRERGGDGGVAQCNRGQH